jgi:hypothetical protein
MVSLLSPNQRNISLKLPLGSATLLLLSAYCFPIVGQPSKEPPTSSVLGEMSGFIDISGCTTGPAKFRITGTPAAATGITGQTIFNELFLEMKKLRSELLGFYLSAQQQKTADLQMKLQQVRIQRQQMQSQEQSAVQQLGQLELQLASSTAEQRERIEAQKASISGVELERVRTAQTELIRSEAEAERQLGSEQQRLAQLQQRFAEAAATNR